jgi:hypothetical protein
LFYIKGPFILDMAREMFRPKRLCIEARRVVQGGAACAEGATIATPLVGALDRDLIRGQVQA